MLTEEKNRLLTRVGPGTEMGEYLRRYWIPVAGATEFDTREAKPVRLLGEDLVLYKDHSGTFGLVDRQCPHRRADLSYGFVEKKGIRCNYHGWLMDEKGDTIEQPYEDTANPKNPLRDKCKIKAYPVKEMGGLLWVYMGPSPAPELPVFEPFTRQNCFREIAISDIPCNWFQCQENSIDPVHFEWMHDNWSIRQSGKTGPYSTRHLKLDFDEFDHGFVYKRVREGQPEGSTLWTVGRVFLWPMGFYLGGHYEWRVPVDDENTLSVTWFSYRVPKEQEPYVQEKVPTWFSPIKKADGRWIESHIINQDIVAWVGQGVISDRTKEMLGASDRGISLIRNRFFEELQAVKEGKDPKGTIRDPEKAKFVDLPNANTELYRDGVPRETFKKNPLLASRLKRFPFLYGQPEEVRKEFCRAIGIDENGEFLAEKISEPAE